MFNMPFNIIKPVLTRQIGFQIKKQLAWRLILSAGVNFSEHWMTEAESPFETLDVEPPQPFTAYDNIVCVGMLSCLVSKVDAVSTNFRRRFLSGF